VVKRNGGERKDVEYGDVEQAEGLSSMETSEIKRRKLELCTRISQLRQDKLAPVSAVLVSCSLT
jgi:hypothetical protein